MTYNELRRIYSAAWHETADARPAPVSPTIAGLRAVARAAEQAEREAIIARCESLIGHGYSDDDGDYENGFEVGGEMCATAIRARGAKEQGND